MRDDAPGSLWRWLTQLVFRRRCTWERPCSPLIPWGGRARYYEVMANVYGMAAHAIYAEECSRGHILTRPNPEAQAVIDADHARWEARHVD